MTDLPIARAKWGLKREHRRHWQIDYDYLLKLEEPDRLYLGQFIAEYYLGYFSKDETENLMKREYGVLVRGDRQNRDLMRRTVDIDAGNDNPRLIDDIAHGGFSPEDYLLVREAWESAPPEYTDARKYNPFYLIDIDGKRHKFDNVTDAVLYHIPDATYKQKQAMCSHLGRVLNGQKAIWHGYYATRSETPVKRTVFAAEGQRFLSVQDAARVITGKQANRLVCKQISKKLLLSPKIIYKGVKIEKIQEMV